MDKNNEQKNNKTPEMKPKQDSFRPWLKLIPAAAVFAAVCVTCYQANKSPVETASVSDNNIMSTGEIKELISQGTAGKDFDSEDSSETNGTSISKTSKKTKKQVRLKQEQRKIHLQVPLQMEVQQGVVQEAQSHQLQKFLPVDMQMVPIQAPEPVSEERSLFR